MKDGFRQCAAWLHTWTGLVVGWVLFFVFVTGTAGYFQQEITRWMQPERPMVAAHAESDRVAVFARALNRLQEVAPVAAAWRVHLPQQSLVQRGWQDLTIEWEDLPPEGNAVGAEGSEQLDAATGQPLPAGAEPRATGGGFMLYRMHYELHYMPSEWAYWLVGVCTMLMLLAIVTGVITHKKIFKDFFTFRPGKGQRSWLDAHNAVSVMALPFFLMITYSGLVFLMFQYMPAGRMVAFGAGAAGETAMYSALYPEPAYARLAVARPGVDLAPLMARAEAAWGPGRVVSLAVEHRQGEGASIALSAPRDGQLDFWSAPTLRFDANTGAALAPDAKTGGSAMRTQDVLVNLHEGLFAGIWGRWLYFIAGLLGCAMIATGLVLWTVKRRRHHLGQGLDALEDFGLRLVETLNVVTIAGLPLAVAAYFWANRLLPPGLTDRAAWEMHSLFAVWLATLFYALARPLARAWVELLWGAFAAYALLPLLNALTTDKHLLNTVRSGDWVLAGFDLTMWALGALFALMALKVQRRLGQGAAVSPSRTPA